MNVKVFRFEETHQERNKSYHLMNSHKLEKQTWYHRSLIFHTLEKWENSEKCWTVVLLIFSITLWHWKNAALADQRFSLGYDIYIYTTWVDINLYIYNIYILVGGKPTLLKNISQLGWLFPIYGKIKHVTNHQPVYIYTHVDIKILYDIVNI